MNSQEIANALILDLPLDEIPTGYDTQSEKKHAIVTNGNLKVVPDDLFGSCLDFGGTSEDYIKLEEFDNFPQDSITVCCWVKATASTNEANPSPTIFSYASERSNNELLLHDISNLESVINDQTLQIPDAVAPLSFNDGIWHHLTITWEQINGRATLYKNGIKVIEGILSKDNPIAVNGCIILGQKQGSKGGDFDLNNAFKGQMACVQIYSQVLSAKNILAVMEQNKTAQAAFKTAYPVNFTLMDDEERNVLYISEEATSNVFQVALENCSDKHIEIKGIADQHVSKDHYHIVLTFKARTFEKQISDLGKVFIRAIFPSDSGWEISDPMINSQDNKASIYLLYKGTGLILEAGKKLDFPFEYDSADGTKGARGTTVELLYDKLSYVQDSAILRGTRIQPVDIINQRGKKNIPLHAGIVGSNTILNNASAGTPASGASSTIKIRVANTLKEGVLPFKINEVDDERNTKFTLLFDNPVGEDWDVASVNQLNIITVSGTNCQATKNNSGVPVFEITPTVPQLKAEEGIEITLSNIHSNSPSGFANIYLQYEDIPGYWDGRFVLQVEKSPIVHRDVDGKRNVGIGTDKPKIHLAIGDNDTGFKQEGDGKLAIYSNNKERIRIHNNGNVGIGTTDPKEKLHVKGGNIRIDNGEIQSWGPLKFRPDTDNSGDDTIQFLNGKGSENVRINSNGNVGIGTKNPKIHLAIGDNDTGLHQHGDGKLAIYTNKKERVRIHDNGYVGIGTTSPARPLTIQAKSDFCMRLIATPHATAYERHGKNPHWDIGILRGNAYGGDSYPELFFKLNDHIEAYINNGGAWHQNSDRRLKKNIEPIKGVLEKVCALKPCMYHFNDNSNNGVKMVGFIAQEVETVFPELVSKRGEEEMRSLSYTDFSVLSIAAIKEQQHELKACKDRLQATEQTLQRQEKVIEELAKRLEKLEGK